ncbi:MAG: hypothetical protein WA672_05055 [Candidatus Angelobacter sp.]
MTAFKAIAVSQDGKDCGAGRQQRHGGGLGTAVKAKRLFDHSEISGLHSCGSRKPYNRIECWVVMWLKLKRLLISGGTLYLSGSKCFFTEPFYVLKLTRMEVHLKPETIAADASFRVPLCTTEFNIVVLFCLTE